MKLLASQYNQKPAFHIYSTFQERNVKVFTFSPKLKLCFKCTVFCFGSSSDNQFNKKCLDYVQFKHKGEKMELKKITAGGNSVRKLLYKQ